MTEEYLCSGVPMPASCLQTLLHELKQGADTPCANLTDVLQAPGQNAGAQRNAHAHSNKQRGGA